MHNRPNHENEHRKLKGILTQLEVKLTLFGLKVLN